MRTTARNLLFLLTFVVTAAAYGMPTVDVTVKPRAGGKPVKQVKTDAGGNFTVGSLPAGAYTLEFRAPKTAALEKQQFSIAVDGTKQSGKQNGIAGSSLVGGVALNVEVASGSHVTGQVTVGAAAAQKKKMVWVPPVLGSHQPGHWVEEGSAEEINSRNRGVMRKESIQGLQEKAAGAPNGG